MPASNSATAAKNSASIASSRSRTVCDWLISNCVRMLLTRNSDRARGTSRRRMDASASGFGLDVRTMNVDRWLDAPFASGKPKRNIGHRRDRLRACCDSGHRGPGPRSRSGACRRGVLSNDFPTGFSPWKYCLRESFVDDRHAGIRVARAKVSAVDEGNLHGVQPAGRDIQKIGQELGAAARR